MSTNIPFFGEDIAQTYGHVNACTNIPNLGQVESLNRVIQFTRLNGFTHTHTHTHTCTHSTAQQHIQQEALTLHRLRGTLEGAVRDVFDLRFKRRYARVPRIDELRPVLDLEFVGRTHLLVLLCEL